MLVFILAESALERVPRELWNHPSVRNYAQDREKPPGKLFLDRSYHHAAMLGLGGAEKRGRPDIVHVTLLSVLGSPLNLEGLLETYIHTADDQVLKFRPETRLPRNFSRFLSLMEQLYEKGKVPTDGESLITLEKLTLPQLVKSLKIDHVVAFTRLGKYGTVEETANITARYGRAAVIVGGFPHGHLSAKTLQTADETFCIDRDTLDSWVLASRIIYEYERALGLPEKRIPGVKSTK
ncbi:MAG TPA: 16S rRNA methyltransferase [Candidatus Bathyarchaeia archaeon]|nr:16S rRNA methyltransferase [Candidatus Bathyarchaeia archaeon]